MCIRDRFYKHRCETEKVIEHYQKFLSLWRDADLGIVEVEDAKKRLAGLREMVDK